MSDRLFKNNRLVYVFLLIKTQVVQNCAIPVVKGLKYKSRLIQIFYLCDLSVDTEYDYDFFGSTGIARSTGKSRLGSRWLIITYESYDMIKIKVDRF